MAIRDYLGLYINGKINKITSGNYHFGSSIKTVYVSISDIFTSKKKKRELFVAKSDSAKVQRSYEKNTIIKN